MGYYENIAAFYERFFPVLVDEGRTFNASSFLEGVASGATVAVLGRVPPTGKVRFIHRSTTHNADADVRIRLNEGVTVTDEGTQQDTFSYNRNNPGEAGFTIYSGPTISDFGTLIDDTRVLGSSAIGTTSSVSSSLDTFASERELKNNTDYALRFTNNGSAAADIYSFFIWYES